MAFGILAEEYEALRDAVRRLAETSFAPHAASADEHAEFPWA